MIGDENECETKWLQKGDKGGNDTMWYVSFQDSIHSITVVLFNSDISRRSMYLLQECFIYRSLLTLLLLYIKQNYDYYNF